MGSTPIDPGDPAYPAALTSLTAPPVLYLRGALPIAPGVTVVGTRSPSTAARDFTRALAGDLSRAGFAIWSGGALGIDAAAHEGALDAGGPTIVVAGGGLDHPYPKEHIPLFNRVLAGGGALLARAPDDTNPTRPGFFLRNQLLAALTVGTVVIEAGIKSGARNTAAAARRLGRPLCVVPHPPWEPRGAGCALELARGACAITGARDVIAAIVSTGFELPRRPTVDRTRVARPGGGEKAAAAARAAPTELAEPRLDEGERTVLSAIGEAPTHIDEVCERTGLTPKAIAASLLTLTLRAVVVEGPAGFFRRVPRP
jgi:DNA processing protein